MRISIEQAREAVLEGVAPLEAESLALPEAAGRVLAAPVLGDRDQPAFDRSMMDGFAVRADDTTGAPVRLRVVGEVRAGFTSERAVEPGTAIRIMTGAPLPAGADAVQMVENTRAGGDAVEILSAVRRGQNVAPRGQELRAGEVAVPAGARLTTGALGVCWSVGAATVEVVRRPRVVVLTTGDELVELHETPGPSQIRDSNRATVGDLVRRGGGDVVRGAIVPDEPEATRAAIRDGLGADVLVLSGGVSMGEYDFVARALLDEGVEQVFHKVHIKPGKPLWFGRRGATRVFGLPGNPVSSLVTARLFLVPLVRGLAGRTRRLDPELTMPLIEGFRGTGDRPTYQPARVHWGRGVELVRMHGSGDLRHFAGGTALAALPPNHAPFQPGDAIRVLIDEEALET